VSSKQPRSLLDLLLFGSATLGIAVALERGLGFVSNMLAARISGPQNFGTYSVVLATAGTMAAYAGGGIGATANRFSGQYPRESGGYRRFLQMIVFLGLTSATLSALLMLIGAAPLARWMLRNEALISILKIAAISSAGITLFECCRGLLVGQQKFRSQLVLSIVFGVGLIVMLPLAAKSSPTLMIAAQASAAMICVGVCVAFAKPLGISPITVSHKVSGPGFRLILGFGMVQFAAFAGISVASWWIALLVARSDPTLTQMGLYAIANQFRGLAALAPALCAQVGYPLLTNESGSRFGGTDRVLLTSSLLAAVLAVLVAGTAIVVAPWALLLFYGKSFARAEGPVLVLLATAIIHMSSGPATQRLSIVRLRALGIINAVWAVVVAGLGLWLIPIWGAAGAALAFLISHALSHLLVALSLVRLRELPRGYMSLLTTVIAGSISLWLIAYWRAVAPINRWVSTTLLVGICLMVLFTIWQIAARAKCLTRLTQKPFVFIASSDQSDLARP
jgi:O-antigen/teichoic acid export membrane protein